MQAREKSFEFLGTGKELIVPFFQRSYVWKKSNWYELLHSFEADKTPFLGSLILKHNSVDTSNCEIIDGQQRLTTVTLLVKALFDSLPESDRNDPDNGIRSGIQSFLFYKENASHSFKRSKIKLHHSRLDKSEYDLIIRSGLFEDSEFIKEEKFCVSNIDDIDKDDTGVRTCYEFYRILFKSYNKEKLENIFNNIFDESKKTIVVIDLYDGDVNEQMVFDTINRAGEKLSSADIIKNNLFKIGLDKCEEAGKTKEDVCKLYDDKWDSIFSKNNDYRDAWDKKRVFGNNQRTNLEFLLYCVAAIKWGCSEDIFSNLDQIYADNTSNYSYKQFVTLINEICEYAILYKNEVIDFKSNLESEDCDIVFKYDDYVERLLLILEKFGVQMFYPYVLKCLKESPDVSKDERLKNDFAILESFVVRRRLSPKGVTDYRNKCDQIIHGVNGIKQLIISDFDTDDSVLTNANVLEYLKNIHNNENAKMILFCIELYRANNPKKDTEGLQYFYTLEHIMPQKWIKNWSDVDILDENGHALDSAEDPTEYRKKHIYYLGNMTLLRSKLNTSVSNADFSTKISGTKNKPGYDEYASLSLTRKLVDEFKSGSTLWNEQTIADRTKELYEEFINIWPFYKNEASEIALNDSINNSNDSESDSLTAISEEALNDPTLLLDELDNMYNNIYRDFMDYVLNTSINVMAYKELLLLSIFEKGKNGAIDLISAAQYFKDFYENRKNNGLTVELENSFFVKKYPYTSKEIINEILQYPFKRFNMKKFMTLSEDKSKIEIVSSIMSKLSTDDIKTIEECCKKSLENHFENL